ncbi:MAG: fused MFS/spermidine synthase [Pirellulales bacterium]
MANADSVDDGKNLEVKVGWGSTLVYAVTIFLSAFLLFQVQPLISKFILPWFGGSPAVWTAAMLFFQSVLFAGYMYAHLLTSRLGSRGQLWIHISLLSLAAIAVAITQTTPWQELRPSGDASESPLLRVLLVLAATVGLPYFVLSSTGPLLQKWFSDAFPGASPYRLFALSNFGSLLALLSYPFFFEVHWGSVTQAKAWSGAFVIFALGCAVCAIGTRRFVEKLARQQSPPDSSGDPTKASTTKASDRSTVPAPNRVRYLAWVGLPALASVMFLAVTNEVCQNVATVPLLWIIPLSLYLLSFIVAFDHPRWFRVGTTAKLLCLAIIVVTSWHHLDWVAESLVETLGLELIKPWMFETAAYFFALFMVCLLCHGQLARLKPEPKYLTGYFMTMSLGGALGGLFVNFVAKNAFVTFFELPLAFLASLLIAGYLMYQRLSLRGFNQIAAVVWPVVLVAVGVHFLFVEDWLDVPGESNKTVHRSRNFYGVLSVHQDYIGEPDESFRFYSGSILHGMQLAEPKRQPEPLTYYGPKSGVGLAIADIQKRKKACHIGVVGLGVGTLATYARETDQVRYYEINPDVVSIAKNPDWFHFVSDCKGKLDIVLGDARLQLEEEFEKAGSQKFDILVLDAFSGDAIPTHLLTDEAFKVYRQHLASDGVLAVHITNTYLDLYPVVKRLAEHHGWKVTRIFRFADVLQYRNDYVLLSDDGDFISRLPESLGDSPAPSVDADALPLWTDQYSNLLQILR